MAGSIWDAAQGCCVAMPDSASFPLQDFAATEAALNTGNIVVNTYLAAMRQQSATADVSRFNALILNPDYRQRFLDAYDPGQTDGFLAAIDEIGTEISSVLQALYLAAEAVADDPALQVDLVAATAAQWLRPAANLSDSQSQALDARLDSVQKRLTPGFAQAPDVGALPLAGLRESTRRVMQAVTSLQVWRGAISGPSKLTLGMAAVDSVFKSAQDWSEVFVGAEDDAQTVFAVTTEALLKMNCDPAAQGYNLGWMVGYMAFWVATTVVFETIIALESPV
ncbi:MAG TPA: hypothetical protein ACFYD7_00055 [Candidatus Wujingus californicus]|uniref:hypothetical protein n=1 Tax=Candidatus Wujingus californicus TaxID=3367618 RepID=UPI001DFB8CE5|nr:hypothetical protein [Planctomycetota bacterium]MDO8094742.1 hypothetical protein [Candidatus Brocadiales bacterium]MDO8130568.1 hypothetical protein [Candidatus Brocadiales bacterium]